MTKVTIEIDLDFEGIEEISDEDRFYEIEEFLSIGAESKGFYLEVKSIQIFK